VPLEGQFSLAGRFIRNAVKANRGLRRSAGDRLGDSPLRHPFERFGL